MTSRRRAHLPAPSVDLAVGYNPDLAQRLFVTESAQGPFTLGEKAGAGRAPGQFDAPRGIATGRDGALYVVDMRNARVQQFSRDGAFVETRHRRGLAARVVEAAAECRLPAEEIEQARRDRQ